MKAEQLLINRSEESRVTFNSVQTDFIVDFAKEYARIQVEKDRERVKENYVDLDGHKVLPIHFLNMPINLD